LMTGDQPAGGKWNFDFTDNRKAAPDDVAVGCPCG